MIAVADSSVLISLSKIGNLGLLKELNCTILSPKLVYKEAVEEGKARQITDALLIEKSFKEGVVKTSKVNMNAWDAVKEALGKELNRGDHAVLSLAVQTKAKQVLTDDDGLARITEAFGIMPVSSADLILAQLKNKKITLDEFKKVLRQLVLKNRISQKISEEYAKRGEEIAERN